MCVVVGNPVVARQAVADERLIEREQESTERVVEATVVIGWQFGA